MLSNVARCAENMMTTTVVQALRAMAEVMHRMDPLQLHRLHLAPPCTVLQRVTPTDTDVVDITTIVTDMVADMAEEDMNRDPGTEEVMLHPLLSRDTMEEEDMDKDKGKVTDRDIIKEDVRKFSFEELCL